MKKPKAAAKTVSAKPSIEQLKDMPLDEYTKLLARDMADTLNARSKIAVSGANPKRRKSK